MFAPSLPAIGPHAVPAPVSTSTVRSGHCSRNVLTALWNGGLRPPARSSISRSSGVMPINTSGGSTTDPSFSAVTRTSPTRR